VWRVCLAYLLKEVGIILWEGEPFGRLPQQ
jgi:hypothetical protein